MTSPGALAVAVLALSQAKVPSAFAPGEVVVRFGPGSEGRLRAAEPAHARILPFLDRVSREIGRPLRLGRTSSGGELVLQLDSAALVARLEAALRSRPETQNAWRIRTTEDGPAEGLSARVGADVRGDAKKLARAMARELELPVVERPLRQGQYVFEVDLHALTLDVVRRLKERPDVDYAQPNYEVRVQ